MKKSKKKEIAMLVDRATAYLNAGALREADALCCEVLQKSPKQPDALHLYGLIADRVGNFRVAEDMVARAVKYKPSSAIFQNNLGILLLTNGKREQANHAFRNAVALKNDYIDAIRNLADSLEKSNELIECEDVVSKGFTVSKNDPYLALTSANLARRKGNHSEANKILDKALNSNAGIENLLAGEMNLVMGQNMDRLGIYESAFQHFQVGNQLLSKAGYEKGYSKDKYSQVLDDFQSLVTADLANAKLMESDSEKYSTPAFIIGFPRSGTTLLDQILTAHSKISTVEEKPISDALHEQYCKIGEGVQKTLVELDQDQLATLQNVYFEAQKLYIEADSNQVVIDKLPLNTWRVPLLWRVFPEAKFILAIRHPCDVVLSCFMQYFTINDAMSHFFTLEDAARLYDKVMRQWISYVDTLPLFYHQVRYEDLINNFESEARKIVDFLGVEWEDEILNYTEIASKRKAINTPSYHQVTQPIYKHAEYRWERYKKQLDPVMDILAPYIEYFGYTSIEADN